MKTCFAQLGEIELYLTDGGHLLVSAGHGVLREGGVGHVCGPRVPAVEKRSTRTFVPLNANPTALSSVQQQSGRTEVLNTYMDTFKNVEDKLAQRPLCISLAV